MQTISAPTITAPIKNFFQRYRFAEYFITGSFLSLAFPMSNWWPIAFLCLPYLFAQTLKCTTKKQQFSLHFFYMLGFFAFSMFWLNHAILVKWEQFFWALPFSALGLPAVLSLFYALTQTYLGQNLYQNKTLHLGLKITIFALHFSLAAWLHGHLFTGLPWNPIALIWPLPILQLTSFIGTDGLNVITIIICLMPYLLFQKPQYRSIFAYIIFLCLLVSFGFYRLYSHPTVYHNTLNVRVVQPNIPQREKWDPIKRTEHAVRLVKLSTENAEVIQSSNKHLIVWPEVASTYPIDWNPWLQDLLRDRLKPHQFLLIGSLDRIKDSASKHSYSNSFIAYDSELKRLATYDKQHLVPFGEYIPWQQYLPFLKPLANMFGQLHARKNQALVYDLKNDIPPLRPLICYEAIFSDEILPGPHQSTSVQWLLQVTNDAWYGDSDGPRQHFKLAQLRAIEYGIPLVRSANTGISVVFDALGRPLQKLPMLTQGYFDIALPKPLMKPTVYHLYRTIFAWIGLTAIIGIQVYCFFKNQ